ncbi:MAG: DUF5131 family protein [Nevskiaceae bacterium]|nr:MAG: DUF5131 family protein [Nevskiaceae bacterium]
MAPPSKATPSRASTAKPWCDGTFNPWIGADGSHRTSQTYKRVVIRWNRAEFVQCPACGWRGEALDCVWNGARCPKCGDIVESGRRRVFISRIDAFAKEVPVERLVEFLDLIRRTPNLDWLVPTRSVLAWRERLDACYSHLRPNRDAPESELAVWVGNWLCEVPPPNVWLGAAVSTQAEVSRDVPVLLRSPAILRFLLIQPMRAAVDLRRLWRVETALHRSSIDWVICGGGIDSKGWAVYPDWLRSLRDQCAEAGVPFLFRHWGEWVPCPPEAWHGRGETGKPPQLYISADGEYWWGPPSKEVRERLEALGWKPMQRVGKNRSGRLLDGIEHNESPSAPRPGSN